MYGGNRQNSGYWWFEVVGLNYSRKEYMRDVVEQFRSGENATRGVIYIHKHTHKYMYIQVVPVGICQASGEFSLC